ncbi:MAG TPA: flagellar motor switch protein FliN [Bryobacteraceae bacterium]|nr:flagellar motor switch protein FliN [Bryobacteraceae bacterium]
MSPGGERIPLDKNASASRLLDDWVEGLTQALESMADQRPAIAWRPASGTLQEISTGSAEETLWWEQPFQFSPDSIVWVATPQSTWEYAGNLTLKAAGVDTVDSASARSTWLEILSQSLSALARSAGSLLGREVSFAPGSERAVGEEHREWALVTIQFAQDSLAPILIAFSPQFLALLPAPASGIALSESASTQDLSVADKQADNRAVTASRTMDLLLDVELPVSISFGQTQLLMKDVLKLTTGSIVELNRGVNEPVEILVNHCLIARGEVVVVDGNYGIRIQEIASRQDRLRSIR